MANKPILVHGIEAMRAAGVREVGIGVSSASNEPVQEALESAGDLGVETTFIQTERELGPIDSLVAAEDFFEGQACVMHRGDGLLQQDIAPLVEEVDNGESDALLLVQRGGTRMAPIEDGRLLRLLGSRRKRPGISLAGVHLFGPRFVREAREGPGDVVGALERLLRAGGRARTTEVDGWWRRVCDADALLEANRLVLDDLEPGPELETERGSSVQGRVSIHPSVELEDTIVRGPVVIGARAVLRDAYVGPYSSIGEDVTIDSSEIEHSIILPGAKVQHLGGRLEASVIGRGARIYRDFALPRAFRLRVSDGNEISLA